MRRHKNNRRRRLRAGFARVLFCLVPGSLGFFASGQSILQQSRPIILAPPAFSVHVDGENVTVKGTVQITIDPTAYKIVVCVWRSEHDASQLACDPKNAARIKNSSDNTVAINSDGSFAAILDGKIPRKSYVSVEIGGKDHPSLTYSPIPTAEYSTPNNRGIKDFTLKADQRYCDQSLPSQYKDRDLAVVARGAWRDVFQREADKGVPQDKASSHVRFVDELSEFGSANVNDPVSREMINDAGNAILADADTTAGLNAADAQRLLVRTLFLFNPSKAACSYAYLTGDVPQNGRPMEDVDGKPEDILTKGTGKPWSLRGPLSPKYYLFNIVRWASVPGASGSENGTAPTYQVVGDDWYLLNYSDAAGHHRDLVSAFRKFRPQMEHDVMRILGRSEVLVVAIHLAPRPADLGALPVTSAGVRLIPTDQAWYNEISIQYKIHADKTESAQVQNLGSLISILLTKRGVASEELAKKQPVPRLFDCATQGTINVQEFKASVLYGIEDQIQRTKTLRWFLANSDQQLKNALASDSVITSSLCASNQDANAKPATCIQDLGELETQLNQAVQMSSVDPGRCEAWVHIQQQLQSLPRAPVYSLYQGFYGAGVVTNLRSLPVSITGSWTATFNDGTRENRNVALHNVDDISAQSHERNQLHSGAPDTRVAANSFRSRAATSQKPVDSNPVCDVPATLAKGSTQTANSCTNSSSAIQDEGFTWWDISVATTAPGYSDLKLQSSGTGAGQVVSVAKVTRFNAYGMLDLYILGEQDVVNRPYLGFPHVSVGLPFAGRPLSRPYFAIGETINLPKAISKIAPSAWRDNIGTYLPVTVRPLFGWVWNKERESTKASPSVTYRALKPQWAIELSFKDIKNAISTLSKGD